MFFEASILKEVRILRPLSLHDYYKAVKPLPLKFSSQILFLKTFFTLFHFV